ncbi:MAG: DNA polymerase III [Gallionellales bacterium RBG_16_57_15]|nr:MAG: DNA polymerase III [Gallionellales bacterium RBG_16_57_15]
MDRNEAVLRELNLYPQWVRRDVPEQTSAATTVGAIHESPEQAGATNNVGAIHESPAQTGAMDNVGAIHESPAQTGYHELPLPWPELKQRVRDCTACKLRAGCTQTVFGVGDEQAEWLFVGEGPGADEDAQGEPFVGQAGKLLDNMLLAINLRRGKNVYIANIVKCRPPNNRAPAADEIATCLPYLQRQIELIKPKLIVALGKTAATALLGRDATLASLRGTLHDYRGVPLLVTYHPAYLLRSPMEKAKAWQDLCFAVRARHGEA